MIKTTRCDQNPLISPADVVPSNERFQVDGVFNCGVTKFNNEYLLLCRVAESVKNTDENILEVPVVEDRDGVATIVTVTYDKRKDTHYDFSDSRQVFVRDKNNVKKIVSLTSLSHLRIARSKDGIHFTVDETPSIMPSADEECWGMEDPRITPIDGMFCITYSSVTPNGVGTSLICTKDFVTFERKGIIFAPENKDVTIFPEKINGMYYAFNRPVPYAIGKPDMWIAKSPDLIHWGEQKHFVGVSKEDSWDNGRIGGGAVPIKTEKGWLKIYHAADKQDRYCLGAFLLDLNDPAKIIAKTDAPILVPEEKYELEGFFGNVVFTCGALLEDDVLVMYYGAADDKVCRVDIAMDEIYKALGVE